MTIKVTLPQAKMLRKMVGAGVIFPDRHEEATAEALRRGGYAVMVAGVRNKYLPTDKANQFVGKVNGQDSPKEKC